MAKRAKPVRCFISDHLLAVICEASTGFFSSVGLGFVKYSGMPLLPVGLWVVINGLGAGGLSSMLLSCGKNVRLVVNLAAATEVETIDAGTKMRAICFRTSKCKHAHTGLTAPA